MNTRGQLEREARKRGYDGVAEMVSASLAKAPSIGGAAADIGVAPNAVRVFLDREGLAVVTETKARLVRKDSMLPVGE